MTLRELINEVASIDSNQTVLDLTIPILNDFEIKLNTTYDEEADFIISIKKFEQIILLEII